MKLKKIAYRTFIGLSILLLLITTLNISVYADLIVPTYDNYVSPMDQYNDFQDRSTPDVITPTYNDLVGGGGTTTPDDPVTPTPASPGRNLIVPTYDSYVSPVDQYQDSLDDNTNPDPDPNPPPSGGDIIYNDNSYYDYDSNDNNYYNYNYDYNLDYETNNTYNYDSNSDYRNDYTYNNNSNYRESYVYDESYFVDNYNYTPTYVAPYVAPHVPARPYVATKAISSCSAYIKDITKIGNTLQLTIQNPLNHKTIATLSVKLY